MHSWDEVDVLGYDSSSSYSVEINLTTGDYGFKVVSGDWSTLNLGATAETSFVTLDLPLTSVKNCTD